MTRSLLSSPSLSALSLFFLAKLYYSRLADFLLLTSSLRSLPSLYLNSIKHLTTVSDTDLFVVSFPLLPLQWAESRASTGFPVCPWPPLLFCKYFLVEPPHPHQAFMEGGHPSTVRVQPLGIL